tara:strand:+ start:294 stop:650 length:357 start_codon:yes stop_codon:yes gene_type:complete
MMCHEHRHAFDTFNLKHLLCRCSIFCEFKLNASTSRLLCAFPPHYVNVMSFFASTQSLPLFNSPPNLKIFSQRLQPMHYQCLMLISSYFLYLFLKQKIKDSVVAVDKLNRRDVFLNGS